MRPRFSISRSSPFVHLAYERLPGLLDQELKLCSHRCQQHSLYLRNINSFTRAMSTFALMESKVLKERIKWHLYKAALASLVIGSERLTRRGKRCASYLLC
ncbi:unnamed protein product (mitochondrion) [Musa textilis]